MQSIILHLDMNSYFASCEQQANPHLRGKPIGVCEHLGGLIIAPSVEAKRLGVKVATPVWEARKICPNIILLPVDPDKYRYITAEFLRILQDYTEKIEKSSIDEAFTDLTEICQNYDEALLLALEIKQRLRQELGEWISCSIGIGPNKLLAKIAADLGEGDLDRICVIEPKDIPNLYERLKLTDMPGIGRCLEKALYKLGIFDLQKLAEYPLGNLLNQFGISGYILHQLSRFIDCSSLIYQPINGQTTKEIKSIGHSYTLPRPISALGDIKKLMFKLSGKIGRRMRRQETWGNVICYFHSNNQHREFNRQQKIKELINDGRDIYFTAFKIFKSSLPLDYPIKIMGVSVSGLVFNFREEFLFEEYKKPGKIVMAMDMINDKYGEFMIRRARLLDIDENWARDTIGFARK